MNNADTRSVSRRTVAKGLAWSVPAVTLATQLPAFATSPSDNPVEPNVTNGDSYKCPGQHTGDPALAHAAIFGEFNITNPFDKPLDITFTASGLGGDVSGYVINGHYVSGSTVSVPANGKISISVVVSRGDSTANGGTVSWTWTDPVTGTSHNGSTEINVGKLTTKGEVCP